MMPELMNQILAFLALLAAVSAAALLAFWPIFLNRSKRRHFYWLASTMLIVAMGAWVMIYFQLERNRIRQAEAEAIETTRAAIAGGRDILPALKELQASEAFKNASPRMRYRLWRNAVKGAEQ